MLTLSPSLTTHAHRKVPAGSPIPNPRGYLGWHWHATYGGATTYAADCPLEAAHNAAKGERARLAIPAETDEEAAARVAHAVMVHVCGRGG